MGLFRWTCTTEGNEGTLDQRRHCYNLMKNGVDLMCRKVNAFRIRNRNFGCEYQNCRLLRKGIHRTIHFACTTSWFPQPPSKSLTNLLRTLDSLGCWPLIAAHSKPTYFVLRVYHTLRSLDRPVARQSCLAGHVLFIVNDDSSLWPLPYVVFVVCSFFFPSFFVSCFLLFLRN